MIREKKKNFLGIFFYYLFHDYFMWMKGIEINTYTENEFLSNTSSLWRIVFFSFGSEMR
jgi:hypothetical protein